MTIRQRISLFKLRTVLRWLDGDEDMRAIVIAYYQQKRPE